MILSLFFFMLVVQFFQVVSAVQTSFPNKYTINKNGRYLGQIG